MNNPADTLAALIRAAKRANGDHCAPHDCYATGPLTGDLIKDLVECPGCQLADQIKLAESALASLKGEAVDPVDRYLSLSMRHLAADDDDGSACEALWKQMTQDQRDEANRIVSAAINSMDTTPPAPQVGLSAWVSEMKTSAATEYWVCVGWGRNFGEYMTVRMSHMRNRSELEVAEWNHLFGKGTKPCIADPKFRDPEQVNPTPSPAPQGGGEVAHWKSITDRLKEEVDGYEFRGDEGDYTPNERERMLLLDFAMGLPDELFATPPAQQPVDVGDKWDGIVRRVCGSGFDSRKGGFAFLIVDGTEIDAQLAGSILTAALAPKEKGNG